MGTDKSSLIATFHQTRLKAIRYDFDVFLAHNANDKPAVEKIAARLKHRGLKPWFDKWRVPPGRIFQTEVEKALPRIRSVAVFVGPDGIGPWEHVEVRLAISQFVRRESPIIPILLPGAVALPEDLPVFLCEFQWVFFGDTIEDQEAVDQIEFGITGIHPRDKESSQSAQGPKTDSLVVPHFSPIPLRLKVMNFVRGLSLRSRTSARASEKASSTVIIDARVGRDVRSTEQVESVSDHELLRRIGMGAYGNVWLARNAIGLFHAVKIIHRSAFESGEPYEREFRGITKFMPISRSNPNFVQILHVGRDDSRGYFYYIMEVADDELHGQSIDPITYSPKTLAKELQRRKRLGLWECVDLGLGIGSALQYLHENQLVHRDIKPSNIIFVNGVPKIADVGLVTDRAGRHEKATYIGTEGYIPPEGPGAPAADIYSLGHVIYEASTGLHGSQFPDLPTTQLESADNTVLIRLNEIILKACEFDPCRRYSSADEMIEDLLKLKQSKAD